MNEIARCPFCGQDHVHICTKDMRAECISCGATGPQTCSVTAAFEAWNERSADAHNGHPQAKSN